MEKVIEEIPLDNKKVLLQTILHIEEFDDEFIYNKVILPHLSDKELVSLYKKIKPIIKLNENNYFYLKRYKDIKNNSQMNHSSKDLRKRINPEAIEFIDDFICYHDFYTNLTYSPTIADVLEQFPNKLIDKANAYYTIIPNTIDHKISENVISQRYSKVLIRALKIKEHNHH